MSDSPVLAVLDYGIGNLGSAQKALVHAGATAVLTADPEVVANAAGVVLPGVGAFGACMNALRGAGLEQVVHGAVASGKPFLGICVGMQMLFDESDEDEAVTGLRIIPGRVEWIPVGVKRPQMQWNLLDRKTDDPMFANLPKEVWMYFVHSLHGVPQDPQAVVATCEYGATINAAFRVGNVFATQFHPEKSGDVGLALLANFAKIAARSGA